MVPNRTVRPPLPAGKLGRIVRLAARMGVVVMAGVAALLPTPTPTLATARPADAHWSISHTRHTGPAPWDRSWTLARDLRLPVLKGASARSRSMASRWVRALVSERQKSLGRAYLDNRRSLGGRCDTSWDLGPDRIWSTADGTVVAQRYASASVKIRTFESCLGGNQYFTSSDTATWDLRTHRRLTLADIVDLGGGWAPETDLAGAINALPDGCAPSYPVDAEVLMIDSVRLSLRDRWTLGTLGLTFHMDGEEASTPRWCEGPELLLTWDQLPLTALGATIENA